MLERGQSLCATGVTEVKGDKVKVFLSPCQSCFKVLSSAQEGTDSFCCTAVLEEVGCEPPIVEVFSSDKEGSKSRINRVEYGSDPTR